MALWLVRAGRHGEYEKKFLDENRILPYVERPVPRPGRSQGPGETSQAAGRDLPRCAEGSDHQQPGADLGIQPRDGTGRLDHTSKQAEARDPCRQSEGRLYVQRGCGRPVLPPPRSGMDSPGRAAHELRSGSAVFLRRVHDHLPSEPQRCGEAGASDGENGWKSSTPGAEAPKESEEEDASDGAGMEDLAQAARDQIAKLVVARFKGHGMARLVDAVLRATGYTTYLSPEGPDKGVDILAAPEPMGFGEPRVCVQVKSGDSALDRPTLDQLIGVMQNVQASNGLLVSWGGFKSSVDREEATQFFRVRLWDQETSSTRCSSTTTSWTRTSGPSCP